MRAIVTKIYTGALIAGAAFAVSRCGPEPEKVTSVAEPTDAEVEAVARAIAKIANYDDGRGDGWSEWTNEARAAIIALDEVRGK